MKIFYEEKLDQKLKKDPETTHPESSSSDEFDTRDLKGNAV
jgi:hypothetical protein